MLKVPFLLSLLAGISQLDLTVAGSLRYNDFYDAFSNEQSPRDLQTSDGTLPDLIAPTSDCFAMGGLQFACMLHQRVGTPDVYVDLNVTVTCSLGTAQFDFRRAEDCGCSTLVTPNNSSKLPKICPCYVCPRDFGSSAISIDCLNFIPVEEPTMAPSMAATAATMTAAPTAAGTTVVTMTQPPTPPIESSPFLTTAPTATQSASFLDGGRWLQEDGTNNSASAVPIMADGNETVPPTTIDDATTQPDPFIFATCVSIDCQGGCNGTCSISCEVSGPQCDFCENSDTQPTLSPTGQGDGEINELSGVGVVAASARIILVGGAILLAIMMP
jgi:hypothetical protein